MEYLGTNDKNEVQIRENETTTIDYNLVGVCEFTSDRRLSSNIYKNKDDDTYTIYTKGSDTQVIPLLDATKDLYGKDFNEVLQYTSEMNEKFSEQGLRCLYYAKGIIEKATFQEWYNLQLEAK